MCAFTIWLIGTALTLRCVWEVSHWDIPFGQKVQIILPVFLASWVGAWVYTFFLRGRNSIG